MGAAPAAKIAEYKVCWSDPDPAVQTNDRRTTTDLLAAIDQTVTDGLDAIDYSIGGGAAQTTFSPTVDPDGAAVTDPFTQGTGRVDSSNLNLASISVGTLTAPESVTRTVTATQADTFIASIDGLAGIDAVVEPSTLIFGAAGETASYTITL